MRNGSRRGGNSSKHFSVKVNKTVKFLLRIGPHNLESLLLGQPRADLNPLPLLCWFYISALTSRLPSRFWSLSGNLTCTQSLTWTGAVRSRHGGHSPHSSGPYPVFAPQTSPDRWALESDYRVVELIPDLEQGSKTLRSTVSSLTYLTGLLGESNTIWMWPFLPHSLSVGL